MVLENKELENLSGYIYYCLTLKGLLFAQTISISFGFPAFHIQYFIEWSIKHHTREIIIINWFIPKRNLFDHIETNLNKVFLSLGQ